MLKLKLDQSLLFVASYLESVHRRIMSGSKVDIETNSNSEYCITPVTIFKNTCADLRENAARKILEEERKKFSLTFLVSLTRYEK